MILLFFNCQSSIVNWSSSLIYISIASRISIRPIYSSAAWERAEFPGPIFTEGKCMRAWSLKVGEPKGSFPIMTARRTNGCCKSVRVELRRKLRAFISQPTCDLISSNSFSLGYNSFVRISTVNSQRSGTTLCCVPAWIIVTLIFTGPRKSLFSGN